MSYYIERCKRDPAYAGRIKAASRAWYATHKDSPPHKEKMRLRVAKWRERNPHKLGVDPEHHAMASRRKRYKLSHPEFLALLERQAGLCCICCKPMSPGRGTQVDHDHRCCPGSTTCGMCIRGLLCISCNLLVGQLENPLASDARAYITFEVK